jgi:hypothetical protein
VFVLRTALTCFTMLLFHGAAAAQVSDSTWPIHSPDRPQPQEVTPGIQPGGAPSDAIILFDGKTMNGWQTHGGRPALWTVHDGVVEVKPGSGSIETVQTFGDCQLHLEWAEPVPPKEEDQDRGNSGVILMGLFEVQVLDSYHSRTYADGTVGAIYGQYPPLVNASRPPGEWQSYDIMFRRPRFDASGTLLSAARITVIQNGILVQDAARPTGPTSYFDRAPYIDLGDRLPLILQEHGAPVRYRYLWVRPLPPEPESLPATFVVALRAGEADLQGYVGDYVADTTILKVEAAEHGLEARMSVNFHGVHYDFSWPLHLIDRDSFLGMAPGGLPLHLGFVRDAKGAVTKAVTHMAGSYGSFARRP